MSDSQIENQTTTRIDQDMQDAPQAIQSESQIDQTEPQADQSESHALQTDQQVDQNQPQPEQPEQNTATAEAKPEPEQLPLEQPQTEQSEQPEQTPVQLTDDEIIADLRHQITDLNSKLSTLQRNYNTLEHKYHNLMSDKGVTQQAEFGIFVSDIARGVSDEELRESFEKIVGAPLSSASVVRDKNTGQTKGYGFIHVSSLLDVYAIIQAPRLPSFVDQLTKKPLEVRITLAGPKNVVKISNFPPTFNREQIETDLREIAGQNITRFEIAPENREENASEEKPDPKTPLKYGEFVWITYKTHEDALAALRILQKCDHFGQPLKLKMNDAKLHGTERLTPSHNPHHQQGQASARGGGQMYGSSNKFNQYNQSNQRPGGYNDYSNQGRGGYQSGGSGGRYNSGGGYNSSGGNHNSYGGNDPKNKILFLKNLATTVTSQTIENLFGPIVERIILPIDQTTQANQGHAFVHFKDHDSARIAKESYHEHFLEGKNIHIGWSFPNKNNPRNNMNNSGGRYQNYNNNNSSNNRGLTLPQPTFPSFTQPIAQQQPQGGAYQSYAPTDLTQYQSYNQVAPQYTTTTPNYGYQDPQTAAVPDYTYQSYAQPQQQPQQGYQSYAPNVPVTSQAATQKIAPWSSAGVTTNRFQPY